MDESFTNTVAILCSIIFLGACTISLFHTIQHSAHASQLTDAAAVRNLFKSNQCFRAWFIKSNDLQAYGNAIRRRSAIYTGTPRLKCWMSYNWTQQNFPRRSIQMGKTQLSGGKRFDLSAGHDRLWWYIRNWRARITAALMQNEVKRVQFGNSNIGTQVDNFLADGSA